ncbi:MAG: hypothetical protein CMN76_13990 [Spirochaetaceae bacterium]|nr:hypothetical protein [Spirochaetaceae bacterium]
MLEPLSFFSELRGIRQVSTVTLSIALGSIFFSGCYTADFRPHPDYPGRRPLTVAETEIRETCFSPRGVFLGTLTIRNFQGDLSNPGFRSYIKSEMEDRGSNFACISNASVQTQELYQVQNKSMHSNKVQRGESLQKRVGIMELHLYYDSAGD